VRLIDHEHPGNNEWLVVNQFTVIEASNNRRPDVVVFVNGLPLGVIELKNAADEKATVWSAFQQLQTYKKQIPGLFTFNEALVISDGLDARIGTLSSNKERFSPWRTIEGEELVSSKLTQLEVLIRGVFDQARFLDLVRHFVVFEDDGTQVVKKMAAYHQYHAVGKAVDATVEASKAHGDRRVGVVWHTQGSGKSLTMAFYAGRVVLHPKMENPTLVVLTDRNDLDGQLYGTFSRFREIIRQDRCRRRAGPTCASCCRSPPRGCVHDYPEVLPGDPRRHFPEALRPKEHRGHRRRGSPQPVRFVDGFARHMRDALPTPRSSGSPGHRSSCRQEHRAVFGDYVSVYDIQRAVHDGATVPIYYESRLAKLELKDKESPRSTRSSRRLPKAIGIRDDGSFFQAVKSAIAKREANARTGTEDLDHAIRQIVSKAVSSDEVVDIFAAAGLKNPDISILSEEFLAEIRGMELKNLAFEVLKRLLNDEIKTPCQDPPGAVALVRRDARSFRPGATRTGRSEAAQVIEELIKLAKELRQSKGRGDDLGLSDEEVAFYDALEVNDSAVQVLGDKTLKLIARELVQTVRKNTTIDWTVRESVRAKLRIMVKRVLRKHGYPPDKQESATRTVLEQAELLSEQWVTS